MSQIEKLKEKFFKKPIRNDLSFDEICKLSHAYGCIVEAGGNHIHIVHPQSGTVIPIPRHGKNVGEAYIKQLKKLFDSIEDTMEES